MARAGQAIRQFARKAVIGNSAVAARLDASPMQVALTWLLHRAPNILLIPGTASVAHLRENLAAMDLVLSAEDLAALFVRPGSTGRAFGRAIGRSAHADPAPPTGSRGRRHSDG